jgi:hypothetical protein
MSIAQLCRRYHQNICGQILFVREGIPNNADADSPTSIAIASQVVDRLGYPLAQRKVSGQTAGRLFEELTRAFLQEAFELLQHLRPGKWLFPVKSIAQFEQYEHLATLQRVLQEHPELKVALGGDYLITPDIVVGRCPASDSEINQVTTVVGDDETVCRLTPLRAVNRPDSCWILHASISCKWTMRSDRAQNIRTEGLNLIRNRKGHTPHIAAVTAEPLPTRVASLALGTGDLDCVYHFALPELREAVEKIGGPEQSEVLLSMINGRRLRDISDLPLDLAI